MFQKDDSGSFDFEVNIVDSCAETFSWNFLEVQGVPAHLYLFLNLRLVFYLTYIDVYNATVFFLGRKEK